MKKILLLFLSSMLVGCYSNNQCMEITHSLIIKSFHFFLLLISVLIICFGFRKPKLRLTGIILFTLSFLFLYVLFNIKCNIL